MMKQNSCCGMITLAMYKNSGKEDGKTREMVVAI